MRKLYTLLFCASITGASFAQSLEIRDAGGNVINGTTVTHTGLATDFEILSEGFDVYNVSGSNVSVKCKRVELSPVAGSKTALCWTVCSVDYLAGVQPVLIAPSSAQTIVPGDFRDIYVLHYKPEGNAGVSSYRVVFYNTSNPLDSAYMNVNFDAALSVKETASKSTSVNAYPNPANNSVNLEVENFNDKGIIKITDALGVVVKTAEIDGAESIKFQTSDLRSGVYFYSLISNNKTVLTRRMVIAR